MEDTLGRLKASSDECVKAYDSWSSDKKAEGKREALQDAIHELRKVASRMEIDVAVSERQGQSQKNIPIPSHRATRPKGGDNTPILDEQPGNGSDHSGGGVKVEKSKPRRRTPRKSASGGAE